jgi:hypothetical protein
MLKEIVLGSSIQPGRYLFTLEMSQKMVIVTQNPIVRRNLSRYRPGPQDWSFEFDGQSYQDGHGHLGNGRRPGGEWQRATSMEMCLLNDTL